MANQVKFYSVASLPATPEAGALYFTNKGELYKGAQRFGAGKVFTGDANPSSSAITGDIWINEGAKVWDGSAWQELTTATSAIQNSWKADISTAISELDVEQVGGTSSYIESIVQSDGKVSAVAKTLPTYTLEPGTDNGCVKFNGSNVMVSGWGVWNDRIDTNAAAIESLGSWKTDLATASVASSSSNGVEVSVTTKDGKVTACAVTAPAFGDLYASKATEDRVSTIETWKSSITFAESISSSEGAGLVTEGQVVNYVATKVAGLDNAMHFVGVEYSLPESGKSVGDIILIGTAADGKTLPTDLVAGQEYICVKVADDELGSCTWELIGDQNTYASAARVNGLETTVSDISTSVTNIETKLGAAVTTASEITSTNANLVTASAVYNEIEAAVSVAQSYIDNALCWIEEEEEESAPVEA